MRRLDKFFPRDILEKYEIYNYHHAAEILTTSFPEEYDEIIMALREVHIDINDILTAGGNESPIPPKFKRILFPLGWDETKVEGDLHVNLNFRSAKKQSRSFVLPNYVNGYNIDFYKNSIALDTEWNSKDQTFDRDLTSMRRYYELNIISLGIIITRGTELKTFPKHYGLNKFGASTTWMGKLTDRLDSIKSGGCPILAIGITPQCIDGYEPD